MLYKILKHFIFLSFLIFLAGCGGEQKKEPVQIDNGKTDTTQINDTTAEMADTTSPGKEDVTIPNIVGTWTGKLDNHTSILRITEQDSLNFKGRISTNFREKVNQEVAGKFNPEKMTLTMKDQLHSRYEGTYSAKLSEDMNSMTGTFTITNDKTNLSFNYRKNK